MSDFAVSNLDFDGFFDSFETNSDGFKISDEMNESDEKKVKGKKFVVLKVIVAVLAFFLLVEGIVYVIVFPYLKQPSVVISGADKEAKKDIFEKLTPLSVSTWSKFDTRKAASLLSSVSYIENVSIDKKFPDKILVSVKERAPVAKIILFENGASKSVQIDENCVLFVSESDSVMQDSSIPLISGIPVDNLQEGMRLPDKYRVLIEQISAIRKLPQKYFAAVSEIQVVLKESGNYELVLYPEQAKTRVLTDRVLDEEALQHMMVVLDVVNYIEPNASEVDLRYDSLSYRCR